ncbi:hypothetical protein Zmor_007383 [Zophobas morio]|uniref:Uncharacterized protein n=1 Tax=Zophobas morio TaxID=2755281 RepID=A0AA38J1W7_9CUCU|nr:hypothetical protein Zmor_007383 [Zophobas morio]
MVNFPNSERVDMRMLYGVADGNAKLNDGAPPHFVRPVIEWLITIFLTDLNVCDFCLSGWMKELVYGNQQSPETIEELQQRVELPEFFYGSAQTC